MTLLSVADRLATRGDNAEPAIAAHLELAREVLGAALAWRAAGRPSPLVRGDELAAALGIEEGPQLGELLARDRRGGVRGRGPRRATRRSSSRGGWLVNARELNRATLARQLLLAARADRRREAVDRLGGLQAQEPRPPFVALWSRLEGFERDELGAALRKGTVVRAMLFRATLHLVSRKQYAALRPALDDVMTRAMTGALKGRDEGLDLAKVLPAAEQLVGQGAADVQRAARRAQQAGSRRSTSARSATRCARSCRWRWSPPTTPGRSRAMPQFAPAGVRLRKPDLEQLVLFYLGAFGPATVADVQRWSGIKGIKPVLEGLREQLVTFKAASASCSTFPMRRVPGRTSRRRRASWRTSTASCSPTTTARGSSPTSTSRRSPRATCGSPRWCSGTASRPGRGRSSASAASRP